MGVGAFDSNCTDEQDVSALQTRLEVGVAAASSNWFLVHTIKGAHTLSEVPDGAVTSYMSV